MASANFDASLARVLRHEGGYTNHPSDPGGPTNFGITIHDYRRYIDANGTAADVRNMKRADAARIYRARYWHALRCDELPAGLDYAVFDYGVNSGTGRAAKVMQRLLGIGAGATMTDAVIAGVRSASPSALIARLCDERLAFLKSLRTWPVFGAGWGRRVADVRRDSLAMAKAAPLVPAVAALASGKAREDAPAVTAGGRSVAYADLVRTGRLKGWRTVIFGGAVTLAGMVLDILDALQVVDLTPLLPPEHALKIIAAIGIVTVALRFVTTGRVGSKDR